MRKNDFNTIMNGYKVAMKWLKENARVDTFTLAWYELSSNNECKVLIDTVTTIDNMNQITTSYVLTIKGSEILKVKYNEQ